MSILEVKSSISTDGIKKTIDKESSAVALDILQRGIYAFPVKSTVRELASNAYDANIERDVAKKIIKGEEKVEDHYDVTKIDGIYHASGWDPSYYDLKYLSDDNNIYILYEEGPKKDILRIKDNGIGLGKERLTGYFSLAYSSKRAQKGVNGRWGLGNKSALSLGIDSYTVINRYNGKKFRFEVFLDTVVSSTPKFANGKKNDYIEVVVEQPSVNEDGKDIMIDKTFTFYYEDSDEFNGLEIIIPIKKHQKEEFFRAIKEQLMYIPNVVFKYRKLGATNYETIDIAAKIVYKDENIIISESTVFDRPHILLGAGDGLINYGMVDFEQLELEPKRGAVGLILDINTVEVTPPRESVVWSAKTRKTVISKYNEIVETATRLVNKQLASASDYLDWLQKTAEIKNMLVASTKATSVIQTLAGIVDPSSINKLYFNRDGINILFSSDVNKMFTKLLLVRKYSYNRWSDKVDREKIKSVNSIANKSIYLISGASNKFKDRYIYEEIESGDFIVIKQLEGWKTDSISKAICSSTIIKEYESVIVPESFIDSYLAEGNNDDDDDTVTVEYKANRLAKLRKLQKKILYHYPTSSNNPLTFSSKEISISEILKEFKDTTVVYGTFNNRPLINSVACLLPFGVFNSISNYSLSWDLRKYIDEYKDIIKSKGIIPINVILISLENQKYFKEYGNFINIQDFILDDYSNGKLVFSPAIKFALTYSVISNMLKDGNIRVLPAELIKEASVLSYFGEEFVNIFKLVSFNRSAIGIHDNFFNLCIDYQLGKQDGVDDDILVDILDSVDDELPDELCDIVDEITDIDIIDSEIISKVKEYIDYYSEFADLTNDLYYMSDVDKYSILNRLISNYKKKPEELGRI
jgi:hypothetical protein